MAGTQKGAASVPAQRTACLGKMRSRTDVAITDIECYSQLVSHGVSPLLAAVSASPLPLVALPPGEMGRICGFRMAAGDLAWLDALGLPVGETVVVLRRAPFGGPLHVRAGTGAEFALDVQCASAIDVVPAAAAPRS